MKDVMANLYHYGEHQLKLDSIESIKQMDNKWARGDKPIGIWVSVGTAWEDWCSGEEFRLENLQYKHKITLKPDANILRIENASELCAFADKYLDEESQGIMAELEGILGTESPRIYNILWDKVEEEGYDGIIIAPYIYEERLGRNLWYYGWDCASGCIWNKDAFERVTCVRKPKRRVRAKKKPVEQIKLDREKEMSDI